ncbi:hypothetical protein [Micromonospora sp. CPCC 206061]|uniref:hypothetical protein n=1 Tax=Micromonospora sp. CPCC 206061 TaxID=3122410 RepID=UPI002FF3815D
MTGSALTQSGTGPPPLRIVGRTTADLAGRTVRRAVQDRVHGLAAEDERPA